MIPCVNVSRLSTANGLWTTKLSGEFTGGDPNVTKFYVEGTADIKELGGHLRVYFKGIKLTVRTLDDKKKSDDDEKDDDDSGSSSDSDDEGKKKANNNDAVETIGPIPKLGVYLTSKKPKRRMVDAHTAGVKIKIDGIKDGEFGNDKDPQDFVANIIDIVDVLAFKGLVVVKVPDEEPLSVEPLVYGYIRFKSFRKLRIRTVDALHLSEMSDMLAKLTQQDAIITSTLNSQSKKLLKPLHIYAELATKAWAAFNKQPSVETATFPEVMKMMDHLDMFFLTVQAKRIFEIIDMKGNGAIDISEFENFLIAKDLLHPYSKQILPMDIFDALKSEPIDLNELTVTVKEVKTTNIKDLISGAASGEVPPPSDPNNTNPPPPPPPPPGENGSTPANADGTTADPAAAPADNNNATNAEEVQLNRDLKKNLQKKKQKGAKIKPFGMSYSGFLEAIEILGYRENNDEDEDETSMIQKAFCFGTGKPHKEAMKKIDEISLSLHEFYKAWLKIGKLDEEMARYGVKYEFGLFSEDRNRERIISRVKENESIYLENLKKINIFIQDLKSDYRHRKDEKRKAKEAYEDQLLHETNKFIAKRAQEKRLLLKAEQEEKAKKRVEEKVIKQKLLLRKAEQERLERLKILENNESQLKLQRDEIRLLGYDILVRTKENLKEIPSSLFTNLEAQKKLNYAMYIDFSVNQIQALPKDNLFLYHLLDCQELNLSNNYLKETLPEDIQYLQQLKILFLQNNYFTNLPNNFQLLSSLQKLDVSNNQITMLSDDCFRDCHALKWLNFHSNGLTRVPSTLGNCYVLEYVNVSNNAIVELPEEFENLIHLMHLDVSHNRMTHLPKNLGGCKELAYLDCSTNQITALPPTFGQLSSLEYMNFQHNSILLLLNSCVELRNVKQIDWSYNTIATITKDFGNMTDLIQLTLAHNKITTVPIEIGLLVHLQELDMSYNELMAIPMEMGSCAHLQKLNLSHNCLQGCLQETMGLIYTLVELDISFNDIDELPDAIVGFQELKLLKAERCLLSKFPEMILKLDKLEVIELPNNRFTIFPIEVYQMNALKKLNLYNNMISLLPRNIHLICRLELDELNLAKNQLQALPIEFIQLLETIPAVPLDDNPWGLLPPKWGTILAGKHTPEAWKGYTLHDCLDFLYAIRVFYDTAEQIWTEFAIYYCTNRLGLQDFLQEIKDRIPKTWHDGLIEYAKHIYLKSRELGCFVKYYLLNDTMIADHAKKASMIQAHKEWQVEKSRQDVLKRKKMTELAYGQNRPEVLQRLIKRNANRIAEQARNEEYLHSQSMHALHDIVVDHEQKATHRFERRSDLFSLRKHQEVHRLQEILNADQMIYRDEKKMMKEVEELALQVAEEKRMKQRRR